MAGESDRVLVALCRLSRTAPCTTVYPSRREFCLSGRIGGVSGAGAAGVDERRAGAGAGRGL